MVYTACIPFVESTHCPPGVLKVINESSRLKFRDKKAWPVFDSSLTFQVKQGTSSIAGFREDRRNTCKGVYPLYYGAYSSHGPAYDSTFANLTKEETELVYNTYSDTVGVQYAESILNFSRQVLFLYFLRFIKVGEHHHNLR